MAKVKSQKATANGDTNGRAAHATKTVMVPLKKVIDNSAQSRGMGVLSNLRAEGVGLFTKLAGSDKEPIIPMLLSDDPLDAKHAVNLIEEHEPEIAGFAAKLHAGGQLQAIGVRQLETGEYDVIFGMRRTLAAMFNYAKYGKEAPDKIEAKVFDGDVKPLDLLFMALEENDDREDESPIDKALTYKRLKDEGGLTAEEIGRRTRQSGQNVTNHLKLLDPRLEDRRLAIHTRRMSVDRALKLLKKRKDGAKGIVDTRQDKGDGLRYRLPGVKGIRKVLECGSKPEKMDEQTWAYYTEPKVREFLCFVTGIPYTEFVEQAPEDKEDTVKVVKIKRSRAVQLLVALGKTGAAAWEDELIKSKLEGIPNIVEDGQTVETESLQKLLDKLVSLYPDGLEVELVPDDKPAKKKKAAV